MRPVSATVAALCLAATASLSACSFSKVDPDETVTISGRALDAAGKPLARTTVLLFKQADIGEVLFGSVLAVGSLGTLCLLPDAPGICEQAHRTTTGPDGGYRFTLSGAETQGTLGTASTLSVVFTARGTSTTVSFTAEDSAVGLPTARLWNAGVRVGRRDGSIRLTFAGLPAAAGTKPAYSAQLYQGRGSTALWSQPITSGGEVDARLLEDRRGSVAAGATTTLGGATGAAEVRASYLSPKLDVRPSAGRPGSRGARCAPVTGTGPVRTLAYGRCAATDGDLDSPAHLEAAGSVVTGVVVDLGTQRDIGLVVVRGASGQFLVETSADGNTFTPIATQSGSAAAVEPQVPTRARFLRVRSPSGLDESLLTEVSVWS